MGICARSATRALPTLGCSRLSSSSQRRPVELRSRHWSFFPPMQPWQTKSSWSGLCVQDYCIAGTGLGLVVPGKGNLEAAKKNSRQLCASHFVGSMVRCKRTGKDFWPWSVC